MFSYESPGQSSSHGPGSRRSTHRALHPLFSGCLINEYRKNLEKVKCGHPGHVCLESRDNESSPRKVQEAMRRRWTPRPRSALQQPRHLVASGRFSIFITSFTPAAAWPPPPAASQPAHPLHTHYFLLSVARSTYHLPQHVRFGSAHHRHLLLLAGTFLCLWVG